MQQKRMERKGNLRAYLEVRVGSSRSKESASWAPAVLTGTADHTVADVCLVTQRVKPAGDWIDLTERREQITTNPR